MQVTEIYASVQGESSWVGQPCTFVRLTGCPLRCSWCDTVYGFKGGESLSLDAVMQRVAEIGINLVELTGGEPLAQPEAIDLLKAFVRSAAPPINMVIRAMCAEPLTARTN